jgi:hypothetical protein
MANSHENNDEYIKELCDLRHATFTKEIADLWDAVEGIRHPSLGHIAALRTQVDASIQEVKAELELRTAKQESRLNGLILTMLAAAGTLAFAVSTEYLKRFIK